MFLKYVLILIVLGLPISSHAGFDEGLAAYMLRDYATAASEWQQLAIKGDAKAQFGLGMMNYWSQGFIRGDQNRDEAMAEAKAWLRKAASQNYASAQYMLGHIYVNGTGGPEDIKIGVNWLRKAANQGDSQAQFLLGMMSNKRNGVDWGNVVPEDLSQAATWYRKAAEQGHGEAQLFLGRMYTYGKGVDRDLVISLMLFTLSANTTFGAARHQASITSSLLSPDQQQEAASLVAKWKVGLPLPLKSKTGNFPKPSN